MKRWFGGNDHRTSPSYFACSNNTVDREEFPRLVRRLFSLERRGWVELIYVDDESPRKVIAYRFTSDRAYDRWHGWLMGRGSSYGRGVWNPFRDCYQYREFFGQPEPAGATGR